MASAAAVVLAVSVAAAVLAFPGSHRRVHSEVGVDVEAGVAAAAAVVGVAAVDVDHVEGAEDGDDAVPSGRVCIPSIRPPSHHLILRWRRSSCSRRHRCRR